MHFLAKRLVEGDDLKLAIERLVHEAGATAFSVVSAVGSLNKASLRMAGASPDNQDVRNLEGPFEIVSLIGNIGPGRTHLHMSVSDTSGQVVGGHVKEGCTVHTTVEIVGIADDSLIFKETNDPATGFAELEIANGN